MVKKGAWISEHDAIYKTLMKISRGVERLGANGVNTRRLKKLAGEVEELRTTLERHFVGEERQGGLFDRLEEILPEQGGTLGRLRKAHADFATRLKAMHHELRDGAVHDAKALTKQLAELVAAVLDHERIEERLTERALNWVPPKRD